MADQARHASSSNLEAPAPPDLHVMSVIVQVCPVVFLLGFPFLFGGIGALQSCVEPAAILSRGSDHEMHHAFGGVGAEVSSQVAGCGLEQSDEVARGLSPSYLSRVLPALPLVLRCGCMAGPRAGPARQSAALHQGRRGHGAWAVPAGLGRRCAAHDPKGQDRRHPAPLRMPPETVLSPQPATTRMASASSSASFVQWRSRRRESAVERMSLVSLFLKCGVGRQVQVLRAELRVAGPRATLAGRRAQAARQVRARSWARRWCGLWRTVIACCHGDSGRGSSFCVLVYSPGWAVWCWDLCV